MLHADGSLTFSCVLSRGVLEDPVPSCSIQSTVCPGPGATRFSAGQMLARAFLMRGTTLPHARMALPILNPAPCPSPGMLTLHGPQASSSPGFSTAPQSTGTLFPAAFVRSRRLRPHSPPVPHPAPHSTSPPFPSCVRREPTHTSQHSLLGSSGASLTYSFTAP